MAEIPTESGRADDWRLHGPGDMCRDRYGLENRAYCFVRVGEGNERHAEHQPSLVGIPEGDRVPANAFAGPLPGLLHGQRLCRGESERDLRPWPARARSRRDRRELVG